jgi:uncharacterized protein with GYD domain
VGALAARHERLDRHGLTWFQRRAPGRRLADDVDGAADFVPGEQAGWRWEGTTEEMEVGAADPDRRDLDTHPTGSRFRDRPIDDVERPLVIPHCGSHRSDPFAGLLYERSIARLRRVCFGPPTKRGLPMSTYIMLSRLTDEGRKTLKERPERLAEVNKEIETMGGRVTGQYAILGPYDFVNVVEAPSNEVIARISVELGSRGTIEITTYPAMNIDAFRETIRSSSSD